VATFSFKLYFDVNIPFSIQRASVLGCVKIFGFGVYFGMEKEIS
jgi:hypothetical protein